MQTSLNLDVEVVKPEFIGDCQSFCPYDVYTKSLVGGTKLLIRKFFENSFDEHVLPVLLL